MNEEKDTYLIKGCACKNCSFDGDVQVPKGTKLELALCPECKNTECLYKKPTTTNYYKF
jgi:hypothetical protein